MRSMFGNTAALAAMLSLMIGAPPRPSAADGKPPMAEPPRNHSRYVYPGPDGRLVYPRLDRWGNRVPDYSYAGYEGGGRPIPLVAVKLTLEPDADDKDDGPRIQAAIDKLSAMPRGKDGFRGALLLKAGYYEVDGPVQVQAGGVVLRGEGQELIGGTVIVCTKTGDGPGELGWSKYGWKHGLFWIGGKHGRESVRGTNRDITDVYVPLGSRSFHVKSAEGYKVGDDIVVQVFHNEKFRNDITGYPLWTASHGDGKRIYLPRHYTGRNRLRHEHERKIVKINGDGITVDIPLYNPIAAAFGGGQIHKYTRPRIDHVGIENVRMISAWDPVPDEGTGMLTDPQTHAQCAVVFTNVEDFWVRDVITNDFLGHHLSMQGGSRRGTVVDCCAIISDPKYYEAYRYVARYGFHVGAESLVYRCYVTNSRHCFNSGNGAGPRVYLDCRSEGSQGGPGPHLGFVNGDLFDNVRNYGTELQISTRGQQAWRGINSMMWNCGATAIVCMMPPPTCPPVGYNWAVGCYAHEEATPEDQQGHRNFYRTKGELLLGKGPRIGDGVWESFGRLVEPRSLYEKQLEDRLGHLAVHHLRDRIDWNKVLGKTRARPQTAMALGKWQVVGPFPNPGGLVGFERDYGPEKAVDLAAAYEGSSGPVKWKACEAGADGRVDLAAAIGPIERSLAYAATWLHSDRDRWVILGLGHHSGAKVWVNGELVHATWRTRSYQPFQYAYRVLLKKGANLVLMKVTSGGESWGFHVDLRAVHGRAPKGLTTRSRPTEGAAPKS